MASSPTTTTTTTTTPPITTPVEQTPPSVTGTSLPGDTLTCDPGTWTGSPTFSYQWGSNGQPILGATSNTLVVTISDEGTSITCDVTASIGSNHVVAVTNGLIVAIQGTLTASSLLVELLPRHEAKALVGRVVMILAANTHHAVDGISPGTALSSIPHTIKLSKPFKIGLNTWYLIRGRIDNRGAEGRRGVAQEVRIANKKLTSGSAASQRAFLSTFRQG